MPATIFTDALPNGTGGFNGESLRNELAVSAGSLGQVRVTFTGAGTIADHCSIGVSKQDGTGSTVATPVELTFSGSSGFNVGSGITITSDWVNLAFASSDKLIVILDTNAASPGVRYDTIDTCYTGPSPSFATATVTGFSANSFELSVGLIETQAGGAPLVTGWQNNASDTILRKVSPASMAPAFGRPPFAVTNTNAGIPWFEPRDIDRLAKPRFLTDPAEVPFSPAPVTWSFQAGDTIFLRDPPIDSPPALERPFAATTVGISGMAWFAPPDRDRPSVKVTFEAPPAIALTPSTLPVKISGMAWFEPTDSIRVPPKVPFDAAPAFGRSIAQPAGISGIAWMAQQDRDRPALKVSLDYPPAFGQAFLAPSTIAGMAWFEASDRDRLSAPIARTSDPAMPWQFAGQFVGVSWLSPVDATRPRGRLGSDLPVLGLLSHFAPPVGISGMAWFTPPERASLGVQVRLEDMPAMAMQFIVQLPPSNQPLRFVDVHGAMSSDEFNQLSNPS